MKQDLGHQVAAPARRAVVDVGSNSVRLVVFDSEARAPAYFYDEKVMAGLGRGVRMTGRLSPEGKIRALDAMRRFHTLSQGMGLQRLDCVATAAMREAEDGPAFSAEIEERFGIKVNVISGESEARLSSQGVLLGWPNATGLVCDIGGASMELAQLKEGQIEHVLTTRLGPLRLIDHDLSNVDLRSHIAETIAQKADILARAHPRLYLVGGSWRAIARVHMNRTGYPLQVLHDYQLDADDLQDTLAFLEETPPDDYGEDAQSVSATRRALLPLASRVLRQLLDHFRFDLVSFSSYGLREGVLYESMTPEMRKKDALIESCLLQEQTNARFPGFGGILYDWLMPLFPGATAEQKRLIKAACLLHDVSWRAHPDYRASVSFESATRANLGMIDHAGRVFLSVALFRRYKSKGASGIIENLRGLISDADHTLASSVGAAMRLGAMMSGADIYHMGQLLLTDDQVVLQIPPEADSLYGEVVEKRLQALAASLGREAVTVIA